MNVKNKKPFQSDRIFVKGKQQTKKSQSLDDIGLLALQISCPYRTEIKIEDLSGDMEHIGEFYCVNIETRSTSAIIFIGTYDDISIDEIIKKLYDQIYNVIKSANEKIYFLDVLKINVEPVPFVDILANFGQYTFLWQLPTADMIVSYVKLEKKVDSERFESVGMEQINESVSETDLYLHFPKNNRYIHYLKKGNKLEKNRKDRLNQRGISKLFTPKDQPANKQKKRAETVISDLHKKYLNIKKSA
jgi:hypothetical protein